MIWTDKKLYGPKVNLLNKTSGFQKQWATLKDFSGKKANDIPFGTVFKTAIFHRFFAKGKSEKWILKQNWGKNVVQF